MVFGQVVVDVDGGVAVSVWVYVFCSDVGVLPVLEILFILCVLKLYDYLWWVSWVLWRVFCEGSIGLCYSKGVGVEALYLCYLGDDFFEVGGCFVLVVGDVADCDFRCWVWLFALLLLLLWLL